MSNAIQSLLDSNLINEETRTAISEAWEIKLKETQDQVRTELREEFAGRYEHDKTVMVEALDKMVTEGLSAELQSVQAEKQALIEDRVKFHVIMKESATKFNGFLVQKLAEEIGELRKDRKAHNKGLIRLENFVVHALAREITEFAKDKNDLVETKVRLVSNARGKLEGLQAQFVKESAAKMSTAVSKHLKAELGQLHEDIKVARENNFGRRIFEAYAAEFGATHLNEKAEVRKLHDNIAAKDGQLAEAIKLNEKAKILVESKERELRIIRDSNERDATMEQLLTPLNREKQAVMRDLLEGIQTNRLKNTFEKYLPAVLATRGVKAKNVITESVTEVTGNKKIPDAPIEEEHSNVFNLKRLAGL